MDFMSTDKKNRIDEFHLLTEIVKKERADILMKINEKNLISITQRDDKDKTVGDTLIHYAVLSGKADLLVLCKSLFENDINTKDFQ